MRYTLLTLHGSLLMATVAAFPGAAAAQLPQIADVFPPGGERGTKVEARIEGSGLAGATRVLVSGTGVKAVAGAPSADGNGIALSLDIAKDAQPGPYEVRVLSPKGGSNPGYLWVGALPEIAEKEPNDQPAQAMPLDSLPVTVNGRMNAAEDVDWYRFHAGAGDTFVFDIVTNRLYAPMDAFLELHDSQGRLLGSATVGYDRDPRLIHTFRVAGEFRLQVRDTLYRGGPGFVYKLTVGKVPAITSLYTVSARRGQTLTAQVQGVNLGSMTSLSLPLPADMPEGRTWWVIPDTPNGPALPVAVGADDDVQMDGRSLSPNGVGAAYAEPTTIHGMLQLGRKEDVYPLHLESGKPVVLTVRARAIGSRMLPYLRITDSAGKELLTSEDQIGQDPRVNFSPPSTGDYRVAVRSVDARGGPQYAYDLVVRPESHPDFRITVTPDRLIAARGQALVMRVSLDRLGGFHAPVEVRVEGLPPGIAASPLTVNAGQTSGIITLSAAPDSTLPLYSTSEIRVVGTAAGPSGGATLAHPALAIGDLPRPGEDATAPRLVQYQLAGINDAVPLYTLSPAMTAIALAPGQSVSVKVTASRRAGDNNANPAIALTLADLPPGVSAETPEIPEKKTEITIKLTASADAKPVTQSALLTGKLGDTVEAAPALVITVKPK